MQHSGYPLQAWRSEQGCFLDVETEKACRESCQRNAETPCGEVPRNLGGAGKWRVQLPSLSPFILPIPSGDFIGQTHLEVFWWESIKVTRGELWRRAERDGEWLWGQTEHVHHAQWFLSFFFPNSVDKRVSFPWKNKCAVEVLLVSERWYLTGELCRSWHNTDKALGLETNRYQSLKGQREKHSWSSGWLSPWEWVTQRARYVGRR